MRLYVAAPLFTEAERAFNLVLARALEGEGHDVYLPQPDTSRTEAAERTSSMFFANLAALRSADAVVAVCDGSQVDDGTAWEIGTPTAGTFASSGYGPTCGSCSEPTSRSI